jgi:hypothetical protein
VLPHDPPARNPAIDVRTAAAYLGEASRWAVAGCKRSANHSAALARQTPPSATCAAATTTFCRQSLPRGHSVVGIGANTCAI